jgi:hypothetical protein
MWLTGMQVINHHSLSEIHKNLGRLPEQVVAEGDSPTASRFRGWRRGN